MSEDPGILVKNHPYHPATRRGSAENPLVGLLMDLQTTLDVERVLELFSGHLQEFVPHSGYGFHHAGLELDVEGGRPGRHRCAYTLSLDDEILGEWRASRDRRFGEAELERLEILLCHLLYPLRNGLRYREALCRAHLDPLTQVGNRMALAACLERDVEVARRYGAPFALIFLDIDHFKAVNDDFGHGTGDAVLQAVARCLRQTVRSSDGVFRYGGEEFVILANNTPKAGVVNLAERIRAQVAAMAYESDNVHLCVTASLGVAVLEPGETHQELLRRADQAMYAAKRDGRNRVEVADQT